MIKSNVHFHQMLTLPKYIWFPAGKRELMSNIIYNFDEKHTEKLKMDLSCIAITFLLFPAIVSYSYYFNEIRQYFRIFQNRKSGHICLKSP